MNNLKLKKKWNLIVFVVSIGAFFILLFIIEKSRPCECKKAMEYYYTLSFNGIITNKFTDNLNHGALTLRINVGDSVVLFKKYADQSGLFEYCQIGDSIKKNHGSLKVSVIRVSNEQNFTIDFKCDEL